LPQTNEGFAVVTKVKTIHMPDLSARQHQVLLEATVPAGFPSPAADYEQDQLDLNKHLVSNPAATFFVRVTGDSMIGAGIHHNDLLVVDRSLEPRDKSVVIAVLNGELTVKRIRMRNGKITLEPENHNYFPQEVTADTEFEVWGVVTSVIHKL
jgi:DNA polymerase V